MCDLIVVTRPGYDAKRSEPPDVATVVDVRGLSKQEITQRLEADAGTRVFLTDAAMVDVSATRIRAAAQSGQMSELRANVPSEVASYIEKYELYRN
jgi:nicotinic acid mononucleotide adenylyltransferase